MFVILYRTRRGFIRGGPPRCRETGLGLPPPGGPRDEGGGKPGGGGGGGLFLGVKNRYSLLSSRQPTRQFIQYLKTRFLPPPPPQIRRPPGREFPDTPTDSVSRIRRARARRKWSSRLNFNSRQMIGAFCFAIIEKRLQSLGSKSICLKTCGIFVQDLFGFTNRRSSQ